MDLFELRDYCLSFEGVTEKMPFGNFAKRFDSILVFYVADHMFCMTDIENCTYVNVRSTPERISYLYDHFSALSQPINRTLRYWIQLNFNGDIPDVLIRRLIAESYEIVKANHTK